MTEIKVNKIENEDLKETTDKKTTDNKQKETDTKEKNREVENRLEKNVAKLSELSEIIKTLQKNFEFHKHSGDDGSIKIDGNINLKYGKILSIGGSHYAVAIEDRKPGESGDTYGTFRIVNLQAVGPGQIMGAKIGLGNESVNTQINLEHQEKYNWRGDWVISTNYEVDDAVNVGGYQLRCYVAHTSSADTEPGVGADWADYWVLLNNYSFLYAFRPHLYNESNVSITSGTDTITSSEHKFGVNELIGSYISVSGPTIGVETRQITANTATQVTVDTNWTASDTVSYAIFRPVYLGAANYPYKRLYLLDDLRFGRGSSTGSEVIYIKYGSGSPESSVTANIGSLYMRTDGSSGTSLYIKESGTGNTGWVAVGGNSGFTSRARAYLTSDQTIADSSDTKVTLNSKNYDGDDEFDSSTNYRFTAKNDGYYQVNASVSYASPVDQANYIVQIRKNGTAYSKAQISTSGTTRVSIPISDIVPLETDDYLELYTSHNSGSSRDIDGGTIQAFMSVHRLS